MVGKIALNDYFVSLPYLWQINSILFSLSFLPNIKRNSLLLSLTYFSLSCLPNKKTKFSASFSHRDLSRGRKDKTKWFFLWDIFPRLGDLVNWFL